MLEVNSRKWIKLVRANVLYCQGVDKDNNPILSLEKAFGVLVHSFKDGSTRPVGCNYSTIDEDAEINQGRLPILRHSCTLILERISPKNLSSCGLCKYSLNHTN